MADDNRDDKPAAGRSDMKVEARWVFAGILAVLFGVFIAQNSNTVQVDFVFFSAQVRLIWVFLICGIIGAIIDRLLVKKGIL